MYLLSTTRVCVHAGAEFVTNVLLIIEIDVLKNKVRQFFVLLLK